MTPVAAMATRFDFVMPACSHCDREVALVCEGCKDIFCMQCLREQLNGRQQCGCQRARAAQAASQHHGKWNWCAREVVTSSVYTTSETSGTDDVQVVLVYSGQTSAENAQCERSDCSIIRTKIGVERPL